MLSQSVGGGRDGGTPDSFCGGDVRVFVERKGLSRELRLQVELSLIEAIRTFGTRDP
jgi:hypothetical protein